MFSLNFSNSHGNGSFYPDAGFKWTDRLNMVNEANFIFSSSSAYRRSQLDIGSIVSITEKDPAGTVSQEFYGFVDDIQTVDGGGMNVHALGQEGYLGKENGVYSGSPWNNVDAVTIFNAIIAESAQISSTSSDDFGNTYLTETSSDSLWNAIMNLSKITGQDVDVNYTSTGATIALKNTRCTGSYVSKDIFNSGKEIEDISIGRSFPVANSVTVWGKGEGVTRIKSTGAHGQDASSQCLWGVIYKPVENYTITDAASANQLADAEVAKYAAIIKSYQFTMKVKRYKTLFKAGDLLTLNSTDQSITNEIVRITQIEKGMKNGAEYMDLTVTDQNYSRLTKNSDMITAQINKVYQQGSTQDQYNKEYSNQNCATCVGGVANFNSGYVCIGGNCFRCDDVVFLAGGTMAVYGGGYYTAFHPCMTVCIPFLQVGDLSPGCSSCNTLHKQTLDMCGCNIIHTGTICASCFCGAGAGGVSYWTPGIGYISPCSACPICTTSSITLCGLGSDLNAAQTVNVGGNVVSMNSTNCLGIACSPGAFAEVNAACGEFTTKVDSPILSNGAGCLGICAASTVVACFGYGGCSAIFGDIRTKNIDPYSNGGCCLGVTACRFGEGYVNCFFACRKLVLPVGSNCY